MASAPKTPSLYARMQTHGTLTEAPRDVPDARFALPSTIHWMRALAILAADLNVDFAAGRTFFARVQARSMPDRELNTVCEQLLFVLNQIAALRALTLAPNKADVARTAIVAWYYGVYSAASAMTAAMDGSFQDNHMDTARKWQERFPANRLAMPPFADCLSSVLPATADAELAPVRARGRHSLVNTPSTPQEAWGCCAEYLSGTAGWERWNVEERVRETGAFKTLGVSDFRTKAARELRDGAYERRGIAFLHQASRYRGKANYRDAIFLGYGTSVPTLLSGFVDDLLAVLQAFTAMAGAYCSLRRANSNANVRYELVVPVSDPDLWRGKPSGILEELLGFLGMTTWDVRFVQRPSRPRRYAAPSQSQSGVTRIALLSGGLDSLCGAGAGLVSASDTQFCSFYTRQQQLQAKIAAELGFSPPTQWRLQGSTGRGRSFYYRSFLFLALAAVTAETFGAREIIQFENGILASAIPPVPSLAVTRHAHPRLHSLFAQLLSSLLNQKWRIDNPLWRMTKRQAVTAMRRNLGYKKSDALAAITQSCWNLSAPHVFGVRKFSGEMKHANQQCGVCIPCMVRRTALPSERFAFDLKKDAVRNHPKLGAHFLEYVEFVSSIRAARTPADLRPSLPAEALDLIDGGWSDLKSLHGLLREFAAEFVETFGLRV